MDCKAVGSRASEGPPLTLLSSALSSTRGNALSAVDTRTLLVAIDQLRLLKKGQDPATAESVQEFNRVVGGSCSVVFKQDEEEVVGILRALSALPEPALQTIREQLPSLFKALGIGQNFKEMVEKLRALSDLPEPDLLAIGKRLPPFFKPFGRDFKKMVGMLRVFSALPESALLALQEQWPALFKALGVGRNFKWSALVNYFLFTLRHLFNCGSTPDFAFREQERMSSLMQQHVSEVENANCISASVDYVRKLTEESSFNFPVSFWCYLMAQAYRHQGSRKVQEVCQQILDRAFPSDQNRWKMRPTYATIYFLDSRHIVEAMQQVYPALKQEVPCALIAEYVREQEATDEGMLASTALLTALADSCLATDLLRLRDLAVNWFKTKKALRDRAHEVSSAGDEARRDLQNLNFLWGAAVKWLFFLTRDREPEVREAGLELFCTLFALFPDSYVVQDLSSIANSFLSYFRGPEGERIVHAVWQDLMQCLKEYGLWEKYIGTMSNFSYVDRSANYLFPYPQQLRLLPLLLKGKMTEEIETEALCAELMTYSPDKNFFLSPPFSWLEKEMEKHLQAGSFSLAEKLAEIIGELSMRDLLQPAAVHPSSPICDLLEKWKTSEALEQQKMTPVLILRLAFAFKPSAREAKELLFLAKWLIQHEKRSGYKESAVVRYLQRRFAELWNEPVLKSHHLTYIYGPSPDQEEGFFLQALYPLLAAQRKEARVADSKALEEEVTASQLLSRMIESLNPATYPLFLQNPKVQQFLEHTHLLQLLCRLVELQEKRSGPAQLENRLALLQPLIARCSVPKEREQTWKAAMRAELQRLKQLLASERYQPYQPLQLQRLIEAFFALIGDAELYVGTL